MRSGPLQTATPDDPAVSLHAGLDLLARVVADSVISGGTQRRALQSTGAGGPPLDGAALLDAGPGFGAFAVDLHPHMGATAPAHATATLPEPARGRP